MSAELFKAGARLCRTGGGVETLAAWIRGNRLPPRQEAAVRAGYAAEVRNRKSPQPSRRLGGVNHPK